MDRLIGFLLGLFFVTPAMATVPCPGGIQTNCPSPYYNQINVLSSTSVGPTNPGQWTTSARPSAPALGAFGYNTTTNGFEYWNGSGWIAWSGGGGGGVTSVSIATANGFGGSSSGGSTPVLTITTGVTGIVKGNGTSITNATAGTDYLTPTGSGSGLTGLAYSQLPAITANSVLGALTGTTPSALLLTDCHAAGNAVTWQNGVGWGCNTISGGVTWPSSGQVVISNGTSSPAGIAYGTTGSNTIVETTGGGAIAASILPLATTGAFGAVKPDGSTITISGGVISSVSGGSGTVTSVTCGTGLSGGTITVSGTCALANSGVTAGTYKNPIVTLNSQGQVTSASNGPGTAWVNCVTQYGVDNTGVTPASTNTTAINSCLSAAAGGVAYFPQGDYNFTAFSVGSTQNTTIRGDGAFATRLHPANTTGTLITLNSPHGAMREMAIYDDVATQSGGDAVYINAGAVTVDSVQFYASASHSFYNVIHVDSTNGIEYYINNFTIGGAGASTASGMGVQIGEISSTYQNVGGVIANGNIDKVYDGIIVYSSGGTNSENIDITNSASHGVATYPGTGSHIFALSFQNVQSDTSNDDNWYFGTNGGDVGNVTLTNCWGSTSTTGSGVNIQGASTGKINGLSIVGGQFIFNHRAGITDGNGINVLVSGALVMGNSQAGANSYSGIAIGAGVSYFQMVGNNSQYGGYLQNVGSPDNQSYGIQVAVGASDYYIITGNMTVNNLSGSVGDGGTGSHKYVAGNI